MVETMSLLTETTLERKSQISARRSLSKLLSADLDFHQDASNYASHALHAFAAKFPPQLPRVFIEGLTQKGETVMDPMMGSGTAIVEAFLCGRRAVGFDIDPLALMICRVKTHPVDLLEATWTGKRVVGSAIKLLQRAQTSLQNSFHRRSLS
jgi:DNA methylase